MKSSSTSLILKNLDENKMFGVDSVWRNGVTHISCWWEYNCDLSGRQFRNNLSANGFKMCVPIGPGIPLLEI